MSRRVAEKCHGAGNNPAERVSRHGRLLIVAAVTAATTAATTPTQAHAQAAASARTAGAVAPRQALSGGTVSLCAGLTIVTAVSQPAGDYESIKTIESVTGDVVRLKYSSEHMVEDLFEPPRFERLLLHRSIRRTDLRAASLYLYHFYSPLPDEIPGTTSIGTSTAVLQALKTRGAADFGVFQGFNGVPVISRDDHPNVYDFVLLGTLKRVGSTPVGIPVLLNGSPVELPAIRARGEFVFDTNEFFFLDNPQNPIALEFHLGVGAAQPLSEEEAKAYGKEPVKAGSDREVVQVIKIGTRCTDATPQMSGGGSAESAMEAALAAREPADIYDIFFTFNSDSIRDESAPRLAEIADVMRRHPDWTLVVQGHTDSIGGDASNLRLSQRRAAAVKEALVRHYRIDVRRLTPEGYGRTRPRDTNTTLKGRARNRRVELVRQ